MAIAALIVAIAAAIGALIGGLAAAVSVRSTNRAIQAEAKTRAAESAHKDAELAILREQVEIARSVWLENGRPHITVAGSKVTPAGNGWSVELRVVNLGAPAAWLAVGLAKVDRKGGGLHPVCDPVELPSLLASATEASVRLHVSRDAVDAFQDQRDAGLITDLEWADWEVFPILEYYGTDSAGRRVGVRHTEVKTSAHPVGLSLRDLPDQTVSGP